MDILQIHRSPEAIEWELTGESIGIAELNSFFRLADEAAGKKFIITGKGPVEAYFLAGWLLARKGAASVCGIDAGGRRLELFPASGAVPVAKIWLKTAKTASGHFEVKTLPAPNDSGYWPLEQLNLNAVSEFQVPRGTPLMITGKGSVLMYLNLGVSAAVRGLTDLSLVKPQKYRSIRISPDGCAEGLCWDGTNHGIAVGVLGDPNSGKSVFSMSFYRTLERFFPKLQTWRLDGDLASPTSGWYLSNPKKMAALRDEYKQEWTPELEQEAVTRIKNLKTHLDVSVIDMPGGKRDGDDIDRIPSDSRGAMMQACDGFIVLCRQDRSEEIFSGWRQALARYGLEQKIIARIESDAPKANFTVKELNDSRPGQFHFSVTGLDRDKKADVIVPEMRAKLIPLLDFLGLEAQKKSAAAEKRR